VSAALKRRIDTLEPLASAHAGELEETVYGIVDSVIGGQPNIIRRWKGTIGHMEETQEPPTILLAEKLEPAILKHKKYKCFYGGRAGTKSRFAMDAMVGEVNSCGSKVFVIRERMKSLKESVYAGIDDRIKGLKYAGFTPVPSQWEIRHRTGGKFTFGGMQNIIDMKGSFKYKFFFMEEAARTQQQTIDVLGPTLRDVPGAELWYIWNPESYNDPMSKEFIIPYQDELDKNGYYEDEYHLIIKIGHEDNPWFLGDESLRIEHEKDKSKVERKLMKKARFNHIWKGDFYDGIEESLIDEEVFDACIDAHLKLGFKPQGAKIASHDPSDTGDDAKGYALRHGVVFTDLHEIEAENGNRAFDMACSLTNDYQADDFIWDCDGMGALLRDQAEVNFKGKRIESHMYRGSAEVWMKNAIFSDSDKFNIKSQKTNGDVFRNRRAQRSVEFAQRCYRTWEAVTQGKYHDPDTLVSFSSDCKDLRKLRAEACKMPLKPNGQGMIQLYTKQEMRAGIMMPDGRRVVIPSPNLFDCCTMSFDKIPNFMQDAEIITAPKTSYF